jgi:hypothetical protein
MHEMGSAQRFFKRPPPRAWGEELVAETRSWMVPCTCGCERPVWDLGGVRWKTAGNPRQLILGPSCRQRTWHTIYRKPGPAGVSPNSQ